MKRSPPANISKRNGLNGDATLPPSTLRSTFDCTKIYLQSTEGFWQNEPNWADSCKVFNHLAATGEKFRVGGTRHHLLVGRVLTDEAGKNRRPFATGQRTNAGGAATPLVGTRPRRGRQQARGGLFRDVQRAA
jgi:hypothetical protein